MKQKVDHVFDVDNVPTNKHSCQGEPQLYIFEDNEAVIKMIMKGRSPTMRHVSRTKELLLIGWFFDRINLEPKKQIKYVDTKNQLADILTKGSSSRDDWNYFLCSFNIVSFPMFSCSHFSNFLSEDQVRKQSATSKRCQKTPSNEGSPTAKAMPSLVLREQRSEDVSSRNLGSLVNPVNADERKEVVGLSGTLERPDSSSEVGFSQVNRQENFSSSKQETGARG